jgi:hypothetical protein
MLCVLDAERGRGQITRMRLSADPYAAAVVLVVMVVTSGCRDKPGAPSDSSRGSLAPVYPASPLENTHWDSEAGSVLIVARDPGSDTANVVVPEATDSTIASFQGVMPAVGGVTFDLFAHRGRTQTSAPISPVSVVPRRDCYAWPRAIVQHVGTDWRVGFVSGRASSISLDSIEGRSSTDSAALAASLALTAAVLPVASDPTFRGLPFRVRSAYTFHIDSVEIVIADVVRTVNEEANPRVEHLFIIGERPLGAVGKFNAGYSSRTAGAEDAVQAIDVLAAVRIGRDKHPAVVIDIEYDDGGKFGLIERTTPGQWAATWRSAYTDC